MPSPRPAQPTYAVQMARPFFRVLGRYPIFSRKLLKDLEATPEDARIPVVDAQAFLQRAAEQVGEENLGLLAARETPLGSFEVLEFIAYSAPTWRNAVEAAFRYIHLLNEAADFRVEIAGDKAQLVLQSSIELARPGIDFQSAMLYLTASRWFGREVPELQVWFTYPEPRDLSEHRSLFGSAQLRFSAPWNGFVHDIALLSEPVPGADPKLHALLREHAERQLAALTPAHRIVEQVHEKLLASLKDGPPTAASLAASMGVTRRTLSRWLAEHGTTFTKLLDDVRRRAATHYVATSDYNLVDVAFLVGFAESSAFVRAFKRWHGVAPTAYRRAQRKD